MSIGEAQDIVCFKDTDGKLDCNFESVIEQ